MIIVKAIEHPDPDAQFEKYARIIYVGWALFGLFHLAFVNNDFIPIKIYLPLFLLAKNLVSSFFTSKKKVHDLLIDESGITAVFEGQERRLRVDWKEIRSARFEDSFIVFYVQSSISRALELEQFEESDHEFIVNEIAKEIKQRNIEYFNAVPAALE